MSAPDSAPCFRWEDATQAPHSMDAAVAWIAGKRDELLQLASEQGAVLFKQTPLQTAQDFDTIVQAFGLPNFPYEKSLSNAVRVNITERVFTANEAPPDTEIFFHHEMAQTPVYPQHLLFYCEVAPDAGGATPICRSDILYQLLSNSYSKSFLESFAKKGLRYTNVMPANNDAASSMGRSWTSTLGVDNREEAEARLVSLGYTWEWTATRELRATTPPLPAVMKFPDGRTTFFNQLIAATKGWKDARNDLSKTLRHGDGSPLDQEFVDLAIQFADALAYDIAWQPGQFALLDNTVVMHARRPYKGKRRVLASLANMRGQHLTRR